MRSPLLPWLSRKRAAGGGGRKLGGMSSDAAAAMMLALLSLLRVSPAWAEAPGEAYSATVSLDATAENAVKARHLARLDGERRALEKVIEGLSGAAAASALSSFDDRAIGAMVVSYSVADERMSSDRYRALYTYHFDPDAVRGLMQSAGLAAAPQPAAGPAGAPAVVLPVYRDGASLVLWNDPNAWRQAWSRLSLPGGPVRLLVPLGGIRDVAAIDAEKAVAGDPDALAAIARQNGAAAAIVALATVQRSQEGGFGLEVALKRYREGRLSGSLEARFKAEPGESGGDFLKRVAEASLAPIESGFEASNAPSAAPNRPPASAEGAASSLAAVVPIGGLRDWVALRRQLERLPPVRGVELLSLSRKEATIKIRFVGTEADLRRILAGRGLTLAGGDPLWRIEPADTSR
jgi:Uncharacterized protein conserved in bacteria (DUF2066)